MSRVQLLFLLLSWDRTLAWKLFFILTFLEGEALFLSEVEEWYGLWHMSFKLQLMTWNVWFTNVQACGLGVKEMDVVMIRFLSRNALGKYRVWKVVVMTYLGLKHVHVERSFLTIRCRNKTQIVLTTLGEKWFQRLLSCSPKEGSGVQLGRRRGKLSQKLVQVVKCLVVSVRYWFSWFHSFSAMKARGQCFSFPTSILVTLPPGVKHLCNDLSKSWLLAA